MSQVQSTVRRAANSPALDRLARVGLACRGILYGLIGVLAVQIALGGGGGQADKGGAIAAVAALPFGGVILWVMVAGFAALALWQASEALFAHGQVVERLESAAKVVVYVFVVFTLVTVLQAGRAKPEDQKSQDLTGRLLALPVGQVIVAVLGLGLTALGVYWIHRGVTKGFREELGPMPPRVAPVMVRLGMAGYLARGLIAALAGVFVVQAAVTFDEDKVSGIDGTLRAFAETPVGPWLLVVIALGLVLFAGYCFGEARWRRT